MRQTRLYDSDGGFREIDADGEFVSPESNTNTGGIAEKSASLGIDPGTIQPAPAPVPPSADPGPGPNGNPAPQGGNPPAPSPPPPAVVSSVPGIKGSEATGGVQGYFGQAGTSEFSRRLGLPAAWFRGGPTAGLAREASNRGRDVLGRDRAGQVSGGYGAETVGNAPVGPSMGSEGGGPNDEEWQRILQAAMRNRFSG